MRGQQPGRQDAGEPEPAPLPGSGKEGAKEENAGGLSKGLQQGPPF